MLLKTRRLVTFHAVPISICIYQTTHNLIVNKTDRIIPKQLTYLSLSGTYSHFLFSYGPTLQQKKCTSMHDVALLLKPSKLWTNRFRSWILLKLFLYPHWHVKEFCMLILKCFMTFYTAIPTPKTDNFSKVAIFVKLIPYPPPPPAH